MKRKIYITLALAVVLILAAWYFAGDDGRAVQYIKAPAKYLKNVALRRAKEWTIELIKSTKNIGTLRKKFEKGLVEMSQLSAEQKSKIWEYLTEFLKTIKAN